MFSPFFGHGSYPSKNVVDSGRMQAMLRLFRPGAAGDEVHDGQRCTEAIKRDTIGSRCGAVSPPL